MIGAGVRGYNKENPQVETKVTTRVDSGFLTSSDNPWQVQAHTLDEGELPSGVLPSGVLSLAVVEGFAACAA